MRIESHECFDDVAEFDPVTGAFDEFSRAGIEAATPVPPMGHYARLSGTLAVIYRFDGSLWLHVGDEVRDLDQPGVEVRWECVDGRSVLELVDHIELVARVQYRPSAGGDPEDPTPFADLEDFDFGLFVTRVLSDARSRRRIYRGLRSRWAVPPPLRRVVRLFAVEGVRIRRRRVTEMRDHDGGGA